MKEFLSRKGVPYQAKDVSSDPEALRELSEMGFQAVPVTVVGSERILGADLARIERAIGA